jgi:hypothetical protein
VDIFAETSTTVFGSGRAGRVGHASDDRCDGLSDRLMRACVWLAEKQDSGDVKHFEAGQNYEYPFSVAIPPNCPPAFEYYEDTHIRYLLTA